LNAVFYFLVAHAPDAYNNVGVAINLYNLNCVSFRIFPLSVVCITSQMAWTS
jgi:hypothetical protein